MRNLLMKDKGGKSNRGKEIRIAKTRCKKKEQAAGLNYSSSSSRTDGNQWNIKSQSCVCTWELAPAPKLCSLRCTREFLG